MQQLVLRWSKQLIPEQVQLIKHLQPLSETERKKLEEEVRRTADRSFQDLWMQEMNATGSIVILLTGANGSLGRQVLRELLLLNASDMREGRYKVFLLLEPGSHSRNEDYTSSMDDQIIVLRNDPIFLGFREAWDITVEVVKSENVGIPHCGLSDATISRLDQAGITHVVHCAAPDVSMEIPMHQVAVRTVSTALQLQAFARQWGCRRYVHLSTCFANPTRTNNDETNAEKPFDLGRYDARKLYESMLGDQWLAEKAKKELELKTDLMLSACIAEHLLSREKLVPTTILRMGLIGPSWVLPYPGWDGQQSSPITRLATMSRTRAVRVLNLTRGIIPIMPVDLAAASILEAVLENSREQQNRTGDPDVRNIVWGIQGDLILEKMHAFWALTGRFSLSDALFQLQSSRYMQDDHASFILMDALFNELPIHALRTIKRLEKIFGFEDRRQEKIIEPESQEALSNRNFLSTLEPYMGSSFQIKSSTRLPQSLSPERYLVCSVVRAAENNVHPDMRAIRTELEPHTKEYFK